MNHLVDLTIGTEFTGNDGEVYKVVTNFNDENKLIVELQKIINEPLQEVLKD